MLKNEELVQGLLQKLLEVSKPNVGYLLNSTYLCWSEQLMRQLHIQGYEGNLLALQPTYRELVNVVVVFSGPICKINGWQFLGRRISPKFC